MVAFAVRVRETAYRFFACTLITLAVVNANLHTLIIWRELTTLAFAVTADVTFAFVVFVALATVRSVRADEDRETKLQKRRCDIRMMKPTPV